MCLFLVFNSKCFFFPTYFHFYQALATACANAGHEIKKTCLFRWGRMQNKKEKVRGNRKAQSTQTADNTEKHCQDTMNYCLQHLRDPTPFELHVDLDEKKFELHVNHDSTLSSVYLE